MKEKFFILLFTFIFTLTGCQNSDTKNNNPEEDIISNTSELTDISITEEENTDIPSQDILVEEPSDLPVDEPTSTDMQPEFPEVVQNIYNNYVNIISSGEFDFSISDISKDISDKSIFYEFSLNNSTVRFHHYDGDISDSFRIRLSDKADNHELKNLIKCSLLATNPDINSDELENGMKILVNSFDGLSNSSIFENGKYTIYISSGAGNILYSDELNLISNAEINIPVDISLYKNYTSEEMQASLNEGENIHLNAIIEGDYELNNYNILEVSNDDGKYCIYYDFSDFLGVLEIGKRYDFYGTIAMSREGYSGCIWIDYVQENDN